MTKLASSPTYMVWEVGRWARFLISSTRIAVAGPRVKAASSTATSLKSNLRKDGIRGRAISMYIRRIAIAARMPVLATQ